MGGKEHLSHKDRACQAAFNASVDNWNSTSNQLEVHGREEFGKLSQWGNQPITSALQHQQTYGGEGRIATGLFMQPPMPTGNLSSIPAAEDSKEEGEEEMATVLWHGAPQMNNDGCYEEESFVEKLFAQDSHNDIMDVTRTHTPTPAPVVGVGMAASTSPLATFVPSPGPVARERGSSSSSSSNNNNSNNNNNNNNNNTMSLEELLQLLNPNRFPSPPKFLLAPSSEEAHVDDDPMDLVGTTVVPPSPTPPQSWDEYRLNHPGLTQKEEVDISAPPTYLCGLNNDPSLVSRIPESKRIWRFQGPLHKKWSEGERKFVRSLQTDSPNYPRIAGAKWKTHGRKPPGAYDSSQTIVRSLTWDAGAEKNRWWRWQFSLLEEIPTNASDMLMRGLRPCGLFTIYLRPKANAHPPESSSNDQGQALLTRFPEPKDDRRRRQKQPRVNEPPLPLPQFPRQHPSCYQGRWEDEEEEEEEEAITITVENYNWPPLMLAATGSPIVVAAEVERQLRLMIPPSQVPRRLKLWVRVMDIPGRQLWEEVDYIPVPESKKIVVKVVPDMADPTPVAAFLQVPAPPAAAAVAAAAVRIGGGGGLADALVPHHGFYDVAAAAAAGQGARFQEYFLNTQIKASEGPVNMSKLHWESFGHAGPSTAD